MDISLIAAMDEGRVIGYQGQLPWQMPADLQHFKQITMGKPIVMGRKTFESIGRALPGRVNIVLTSQVKWSYKGVLVAHSLKEALGQAGDVQEVMVIGGAGVFEEALTMADKLYLTFIHHAFKGDTYFPAWNEAGWLEVERLDHAADDQNLYPYSFVTMIRTE